MFDKDSNKTIDINKYLTDVTHGTAIEHVHDDYYRIQIENLGEGFLLFFKLGLHFEWADSIWIEPRQHNHDTSSFDLPVRTDNILSEQFYNIPQGPEDVDANDVEMVEEVKFTEGQKRIFLYNPLEDDTPAPSRQDKDKDPILYGFFHSRDRYSIRHFMDFLEIELQNTQLYDIYHLASEDNKTHCVSQSSAFSSESILIRKEKVLWGATHVLWNSIGATIPYSASCFVQRFEHVIAANGNLTIEEVLTESNYMWVMNMVYPERIKSE